MIDFLGYIMEDIMVYFLIGITILNFIIKHTIEYIEYKNK